MRVKSSIRIILCLHDDRHYSIVKKVLRVPNTPTHQVTEATVLGELSSERRITCNVADSTETMNFDLLESK